jgi:hypothetical protein
MIYRGFDLSSIFKSRLDCLDFIYTAESLKPCCRLIISIKQLIKIKPILISLNMKATISDYKIQMVPDIGKGAFSNMLKVISRKSKGGYYILYISKNKENSFYAKRYDFASSDSNDQKLGKILGYPDCCCSFYNLNKAKAKERQFDFISFLKETEGLYLINYLLRYFDISLINHFPCSLNCKCSIKIAESNLDCLSNNYPEIAETLKRELNSIVFYTEDKGVAYSTNYSLNPFKLFNLYSTEEKELTNNLKKGIIDDSIRVFRFFR